MYADNTNVTFSAAIPDLESQINSDLKYIDCWLRDQAQCRQTELGLGLGVISSSRNYSP